MHLQTTAPQETEFSSRYSELLQKKGASEFKLFIFLKNGVTIVQ